MSTKQDFRGVYSNSGGSVYLSVCGHRALACGGDVYWVQAQLSPEEGWPLEKPNFLLRESTSLALPREYMT